MTLLVMTTITGCIFAAPYQIPKEDIEYKTFNDVQYVTEYVAEFNSQEDFERKFLPTSNIVKRERKLAMRCEPASQVSIEKKKKYGPKDKFYRGFEFDKTFTVEDGVLGMKTSAYRVPNNTGGYDYHAHDGEINSGEWWATIGQGRTTEESYFMHLDGKKMFEMKFKVPRSIFAFEVFFLTRDSTFDNGTDMTKYKTSKGEYVDEIDMMELTTDGIRNSQETPKNYISPRGIIQTTENGKYAFNSLTIYDKPGNWETFNRPTYIKNSEKWCNEWHTLNVELTPTSMVCYLDGKVYKSLSWEKKIGEIPPEQEWNIRVFPRSFDCWTSSIDWDNGEYGTFYIDYIKVYKESK